MSTTRSSFARVVSCRLWPKKLQGSVIAIRTRKPAKNIPFGWLNNLIFAAKGVRNAAEIAPFPYIKVAASLVIQALEMIQAVRQNQEDFRDLAESLVNIIVAIRETLRASYNGYSLPSDFTTRCEEFVEKLTKMSAEINETVRQTQSWTRYFKSATIRDAISRYQKQIENARANFTLTTVIQLSLKVFAEENPRQLSYTWEFSKPVRLIDAMNITVQLPMDFCSTLNDFDDLLRFIFRKRRGRHYVEQGQYALTVEDEELNDHEAWHIVVKPGVTIVMDIVLRSETRDADKDSRQCPSCEHLCIRAVLGDEVTCPCCGTFFRVSHGIIEEAGSQVETPMPSTILEPPAPKPIEDLPQVTPQDEANDEEMDIKYFRRFRVLLEELKAIERDIDHSALGDPSSVDDQIPTGADLSESAPLDSSPQPTPVSLDPGTSKDDLSHPLENMPSVNNGLSSPAVLREVDYSRQHTSIASDPGTSKSHIDQVKNNPRNDVQDDGIESDTAETAKIQSACTRCKALKVKCEYPADTDKCKRCLNGGHPCSHKKRRGPLKRERVLNQIRKQADDIKALMHQLETTNVKPPPVESTPSSPFANIGLEISTAEPDVEERDLLDNLRTKKPRRSRRNHQPSDHLMPPRTLVPLHDRNLRQRPRGAA